MRVLRFRRKLKLICYRFIFYPFFLLFLVVLIVLLGLLLTTSYYENWFNLYLFDYGTDETFTSENILDTLPPFFFIQFILNLFFNISLRTSQRR